MEEDSVAIETDDGDVASEDDEADGSNQLPQMNRRRVFMDLFNAEPANPSAPGGKPKVRTETFNKMFDKSNRPAHAGPVSIELEQFLNNRTQQFNERPISISGLVVPTATKGRANAPESVTGFKAGMSFKQKKKGRNETQADVYRNRGRPDVQKGHIMALELGGPDIPKNIVPQWANWQANGAWRKMEKMVLAKAEEVAKRGRYVMFRAEPIYRGSALDPIASFNAKSFPSSFKIHAWEVDAKNQAVAKGWTFEAELDAHQDATDDMMFYRQDDRTMREQGQESPYDLEKDLGGKRAGEKKPKGGGKKK
jgi:hypothetical protein